MLFPFLPNRPMSSENSGRGVPYCNRDSNLAVPALVSSPPTNVHRLPSSLTNEQEELAISSGGDPSVISKQFTPASRLEGIGRSYQAMGFSESVRNLLLGSWKKGTSSAYNSAWKKWHGWCLERETDPFSAPLAVVLDFLAWMHLKGYEYTL